MNDAQPRVLRASRTSTSPSARFWLSCKSPRRASAPGREPVVESIGGERPGQRPRLCAIITGTSMLLADIKRKLMNFGRPPRRNFRAQLVLFSVTLAGGIGSALFATASRTSAQSAAENSPAGSSSSKSNETNAELQSAVSQFSRREEDLPKGPAPR